MPIGEDIKTGIKGIRGAGDALRGGLMQATDELFDSNPRHPTTEASRTKNQMLHEKGKADMGDADAMIARNEWERKARKEGTHGNVTTDAGLGHQHPHQNQYQQHVVREPALETTVPAGTVHEGTHGNVPTGAGLGHHQQHVAREPMVDTAAPAGTVHEGNFGRADERYATAHYPGQEPGVQTGVHQTGPQVFERPI